VEGVYLTSQAFLTRVYISNRWIPPYKALLTANRLSLYNLKDGRQVAVQRAKR
jgi:hypothetical protein